MNIDEINKKASSFRKKYGHLPTFLIVGKKEIEMLYSLEMEVLTTGKLPDNWEFPIIQFRRLLDVDIFSMGHLAMKIKRVDKESYFEVE